MNQIKVWEKWKTQHKVYGRHSDSSRKWTWFEWYVDKFIGSSRSTIKNKYIKDKILIVDRHSKELSVYMWHEYIRSQIILLPR